jgi:hypothetical protein
MRAADVAIAVAALEQTLYRTVLPRESVAEVMTALRQMEDYDARGEGFNRALVADRITMAALLPRRNRSRNSRLPVGAERQSGARWPVGAPGVEACAGGPLEVVGCVLAALIRRKLEFPAAPSLGSAG